MSRLQRIIKKQRRELDALNKVNLDLVNENDRIFSELSNIKERSEHYQEFGIRRSMALSAIEKALFGKERSVRDLAWQTDDIVNEIRRIKTESAEIKRHYLKARG